MATCKECLHHDACIGILKASFARIQEKEIEQVSTRKNNCEIFKPAADVVLVVRCKDCKYRNPDGYKCRRDNLWHASDDFCSYGMTN